MVTVNKPSYAQALLASAVFTATALGMLMYAMLVGAASSINTFMVAGGLLLLLAVGANAVMIVRTERSKKDQHAELSDASPMACPDYWTSSYDACSGSACAPVFQEATGQVLMTVDYNKAVGTSVTQLTSGGTKSLCQTNRDFPWVEVSNACDARNRRF
jgi:hypothetical protein